MISFDVEKRVFHLKNTHLSCVLWLRPDETGNEELLFAYLGAPIVEAVACIPLADLREMASFDSIRQTLPYACPTEGRGDFRPAMLCARDTQGQCCTELVYQEYKIHAGKQTLSGLPATYVEAPEEAETLQITLRDPLTGLEAEISYTIFAQHATIATSVRYTNNGTALLTLENAGSFCLTLWGRYDLLHLHGAWTRERKPERVAPACLTRSVESCRGASGHEHNPFVALLSPDATEFTGECYGVSLVYSGDFQICVDENAYESTRLVAGLNPRTFSWRLEAGESLQAPEVLCVYSPNGMNGMSQTFHTLMRTRLCRGTWRDKDRPILINNWEATYFDFDHEKIMNIARVAATLGVELFVLDDGWFGHRDSDNSSLGDWVTDKRKLPKGLSALANDVNTLGMRFGLWFEPEMVSPDSDLYRIHPEWCLHAQHRRRTEARQQLILDMSRADVQEYVIGAVSDVLGSAPIGYVKWDMNRNFKEAGSVLLADGRQSEVAHRYMLGLYHVLEAITALFPEVLFESCSGGGGRFDAGMLYYMPQTWTSDDTDAIERLGIQYGTSMCYPTSAMGAHVSAIPNHQMQRMTSMRMRGDVALGGNFGYELDLSVQTPEDMEEIGRQIGLVKEIRSTTQRGVFTRLLSPFEGRYTAWQFVDDKRIVLCLYRTLMQPNAQKLRVRLRGLNLGATYRGQDDELVRAETLMGAGFCPQLPSGDFSSLVLVFDRVQ